VARAVDQHLRLAPAGGWTARHEVDDPADRGHPVQCRRRALDDFDLAKVHRVLELLERETLVLSILTNVPEGTGIQIGGELPVNDDVDISVVSTTYQVGGRAGGSVGVIGPMRMDYRRVISAVEEVRENLEESLGSS